MSLRHHLLFWTSKVWNSPCFLKPVESCPLPPNPAPCPLPLSPSHCLPTSVPCSCPLPLSPSPSPGPMPPVLLPLPLVSCLPIPLPPCPLPLWLPPCSNSLASVFPSGFMFHWPTNVRCNYVIFHCLHCSPIFLSFSTFENFVLQSSILSRENLK